MTVNEVVSRPRNVDESDESESELVHPSTIGNRNDRMVGVQRLADGARYQTPVAVHYGTETGLESSDTMKPP